MVWDREQWGPRGTEDKTGQGTRARIKKELIALYGPFCHLCTEPIDLTLLWPDDFCYTRDHLVCRAACGDDSPENQRPAHNLCNRLRGRRQLPWTPPNGWPKPPQKGDFDVPTR